MIPLTGQITCVICPAFGCYCLYGVDNFVNFFKTLAIRRVKCYNKAHMSQNKQSKKLGGSPMRHFFRPATLLTAGLLAVTLLTGCQAETDLPNESMSSTETDIQTEAAASTLDYTVTVLDYQGTPLSDVVVTILKAGEEVKKNVSKADGTAKFKLDADNYEVSVTSTAGDFYYDAQTAVLSPNATSLTLTLYSKASTEHAVTIWPAGGERNALPVGEGATFVALDGGMTYVVFRPERDGVYEISYLADGNIDLGYYGSPMVVFDTKMLETIDNKIILSVHASSINTEGATAMFVFGLEPDAVETDGCIVTVTRTGDPEKTPADEPWIEYRPTQVKAYEGTVSGTFKDIDVTNPSVTVVYNETDGYYHYGTADGPVVFIRITTDSPYLAALTTVAEKSRVGVYQYDENGKFTGKESYHNMIAAYAEIVNGDGVCPLTPELEYMIKTFGEYQKWWDLSFSGNIFQDKIVAPETAWLFICGYYA